MVVRQDNMQSMPLGVVVRRLPGVTRWSKWCWRAIAVLPGASAADWQVLRAEGDCVEYHAATVSLELHGAEAESYLTGLSANVPSVYVVMRENMNPDSESPVEIVLATASPYEAQDYADSGEEIVEKVPMPEGLVAWVRNFAEAHHEHEAFVKRRRDRVATELVEDGIGDPRISQLTDVYRSPISKKKEFLH